MRRMEGDVESAKAMVESFEESSPEKKLKFYRDMTFYGHNLVECLREKVRNFVSYTFSCMICVKGLVFAIIIQDFLIQPLHYQLLHLNEKCLKVVLWITFVAVVFIYALSCCCCHTVVVMPSFKALVSIFPSVEKVKKQT